MGNNMKKILLGAVCALMFCFGTVAAQTNSSGASAASASSGAASQASQTTGIHTPLFLGSALGFGTGTGVGSERGVGLRQIEPMFGIWFPHVAFFRAGYGFFDFDGEGEDGSETEIEHYNLDVELGVHVFGDLYVVGNFSRAKELSDVGDVSWNEWGAGFGTIFSIFSKTMLFADVGYRWVLDHYDPFLNKNVSGSRLQMNLGFITYIY
jgi:hypothetical protein